MVHGQGSLSTEDISGLLRCLPSADEREMLQRHSARYAELGMAEQFMLSMMSISQVRLTPPRLHFHKTIACLCERHADGHGVALELLLRCPHQLSWSVPAFRQSVLPQAGIASSLHPETGAEALVGHAGGSAAARSAVPAPV